MGATPWCSYLRCLMDEQASSYFLLKNQDGLRTSAALSLYSLATDLTTMGSKRNDPPTVDEHCSFSQPELGELPTNGLQGSSSAEEATIQMGFKSMSRGRVVLLLSSLGICSFLYAIANTIVATSATVIASKLHIEGSITWITSSYLLTSTAFMPIMGRLAAVSGQKNLLITELWVFMVGNIIAGTAKNLTQLVAGQLVSGVGGAGLLTLACIIITELTDERERSLYMNLVNIIFIVADAIGPVLGSAFALEASWRWIFLFNAPCGAFITIVLFFTLRLPPSSQRVAISIRQMATELDIGGMLTITTSLALLVIALNVGGQSRPWNSSTVIGLLVGSGASFLAFVAVEKWWAEKPLAPIGLFTSWKGRNLPLMLVVRTLLFFHLFALTFYIPIFLHIVLEMSILVSALLVIPFLATASVSSGICSAVSARAGIVRPILLCSLVVLLVGLSLMTTLDGGSSLGLLIGYSIVCGLGFGAGTQISFVVAQEGQDMENLPTVTALMSTTTPLGGVIGVTLVGSILTDGLRRKLEGIVAFRTKPNYSDPASLLNEGVSRSILSTAYGHAFSDSFYVLIGVAGLQFLLCLLLKRVRLEGKAVKGFEEEKRPVI